MTLLRDQLAAAEDEVERIKRRIAAATCREAGCDMQFTGGMNAGCRLGDSCGCSIPVHTCSRCGDSDYGDTPEAEEIRRRCEAGDPNWEMLG